MGTDPNDRSGQILDLAARRRREKQVVDVEVEKTLIVIFYLSDHGSSAAPPPAAAEMPHHEEELYGLPASAIESIVQVEEITYVPGTPPWILGVVNVRGEIESVLDLKAVLGKRQSELTPQGRLLIARDGELRSGLLVDRVVDIAEMASSAIHPPPTPLEGGKGVYIAGEAQYAGRMLVILDLSEIFHRALETDQV